MAEEILRASNIVSMIYLLIALFGLASRKDNTDSSRLLIWVFASAIIGCMTDVLRYVTNDAGVPDTVLKIIWIAYYSMGSVSLILYIHYCYSYILEKTTINKLLFIIPSAIVGLVYCYIVIVGIQGKIIQIKDSIVTEVAPIPLIATIVQMMVIIYLMGLSFSKSRKIGLKSVFILGTFGFFPLLASLYSVITGSNYTYVAGAVALMIIYVLLQNERSAEKDKEQQRLLLLKNEELANVNQKQKKQIQEITKLNHSLAEYSSIISNAGLGVWHIIIRDGAKPQMAANEKMRELLGISGKEMSEEEIYSFWYDRISSGAMDSVQKSVGEMLNGQFSENTYQWNHPTKGMIYTRCGGTSQTLDDGTKVLSGYHGDVTEIVHAEQLQKQELWEARNHAEAANHAKTMFLNNMSHDIRTPMNAILGFTRLMDKQKDDPKVVSDYLTKIEESGEYLLSIINNVLDMARIESGKVEFSEDILELDDEKSSIPHMFDTEVEKKNLTFIHSMDVTHHYVLTDKARMHQIVINLLSNAIKYTPDHGTIELKTVEVPCSKKDYAMYILTVSDNGIGMSQEYQKQIFESFSREKTTTESKVIGTGLGMSIVKKLVDLMGGTIEVQSEQGKGTKFILELTQKIVYDPQEYLKRQLSESNTSVDIAGKRILLAEDNDLNAEIAMAILEEVGLIIERAVDGVECVDMLYKSEAGYYDLILMDIQMPNMDGYKATSAIRKFKDPIKSQIPIIAMTANAFEEDKQNALNAGMNGHLAKPIEIERLMEMLSGILK